METRAIRYRREGEIVWLVLDRPDKLNAIDVQFTVELREAVIRVDEDDGVRAVVIIGTGKAFCAGGDLKAMASAASGTDGGASRFFLDANLHFHPALAMMAASEIPYIAAVSGAVYGAGLSLALGCDVIIAAESARFNWGYTSIGLVPDGGSSLNLPRLVGMQRAMELAFTGRTLTAREAREWGFVNAVHPDERFETEVCAFAAHVAEGPTRALGATKRLIRAGLAPDLEAHMERENRAIAGASATEDFSEGVASFLEGRKPRFKGR
ncbi:enoyl-CoA hydratase/isomerase family protein [Thermodesulfobacteriota bacterium]